MIEEISFFKHGHTALGGWEGFPGKHYGIIDVIILRHSVLAIVPYLTKCITTYVNFSNFHSFHPLGKKDTGLGSFLHLLQGMHNILALLH